MTDLSTTRSTSLTLNTNLFNSSTLVGWLVEQRLFYENNVFRSKEENKGRQNIRVGIYAS